MQRSVLCRSRRELSNEYLVAKIGFDTAENELCKVCPLSVYRSPRLGLWKLECDAQRSLVRHRGYGKCDDILLDPDLEREQGVIWPSEIRPKDTLLMHILNST